jgi:endothelin-converting enzyme/putative endopeptidase
MNFALKFPAARIFLLAFVALACSSPANPQADPDTAPQTGHGVVLVDMDRSLKPGDDFFRYSNGNWLRTNVIPADRSSVSVFSQLSELSDHRVAGLIDSVANSSEPGTPATRKIADLYHSYIDEATIESRGLAPLQSEFAAINAIRDKRGLASALGRSLRADEDPLNFTNYHTPNFLGLWVSPGFRDADHYAAYLLQGGIELPDREYYLQDDEQMRATRARYRTHVIAMLKLAKISDAEARADRVISLEHAIAEHHWTLAVSQEVRKANNLWKPADFAAKAPGLDWTEFFRAAGLPTSSPIYVWQSTAISGEAALVASTPLSAWKDWLTYHALEDHADSLSNAIANEHFAFFNNFLSGTPEQAPRQRRAIDEVNFLLGDEVGRLYAAKYFPPESKAMAQTMVANIVAAFHKRIDALPWMADATKSQAHKKLSALYIGIGYPEVWRDYSALEIKPDDLLGNELRSELFEYRYSVSRLGKPVERREWCMTPQTVNAVNLPVQNALNFPAAILEPPFFDPKAPDAVNYAAIGTIIGHEITHTFDSEGSAFDAKGQLRNWWMPEDFEHFRAATDKLANQYDQYHPFPDLAINGKQTLPENIADLGGLAAAYDAYRETLKGAGTAKDGDFSGDQQFFISYAQSHRSHARDAALRRQVMTDEHSPWEYRADMVRNIDAWYGAFGVKAGEKLYLAPQDRVRIW